MLFRSFEANYLSGEPSAIGCDDWKWVRPQQLSIYAMPRADRRIIEQLARNTVQGHLFSSLTEERIRVD